MRWFKRKPEPEPEPEPPKRFRSDCPACGWDFGNCLYSKHSPEYRRWIMTWIPEEQALKVTCPNCNYSWKRLAEDEKAAFILGSCFEEKA